MIVVAVAVVVVAVVVVAVAARDNKSEGVLAVGSSG